MKKFLALVMVISIFASFISCKNSDDEDSGVKCTENVYPLYIAGEKVATMSLYFINDVNDIPYIEVDDGVEILKSLFQFFYEPTEFALYKEGSVATIVRNNETYSLDIPVTIDFEKDFIRFQDYDIFFMLPAMSTILDLTSFNLFDSQNRPRLMQRVEPKYLPRFGDPVEINLGSYGIDLVVKDGKYLMPLQTYSDVFVTPPSLNSVYFNGKSIIIDSDLSKNGDPEVRSIYYEGEHGERSSELAKFGYGELCMMLDTLYGLKDCKEITSFDKLFQTVGSSSVESRAMVQEYSLKSYLLGPSVFTADKAIYTLIGDYLDDNHCKWFNFSYLTGEHEGYEPNGASRDRMSVYQKRYATARSSVYPDGVPDYEEIGDTAFVTFDYFLMNSDIIKKEDDLDLYYTLPIEELPEKDTISTIIKAHNKITRENSPIKNVVIDLCINGGGAADLGVFVASWYLGVADISVKNTLSGALCTTSYRADVNLDHEFDEKDTLGDRKLFCLTSPYSFSCGNLLPSVLSLSEKVTILGKTSGGGACVVSPVSSAWGTSFRISSFRKICYMKNGSYYDVDQGVEPDYTITSPESCYNRAELVEFINSLK